MTSKRLVRRPTSAWQEIVSDCEASGLSGAAFCEREGLSYSTFCRWRRRLRDASEFEFVPLSGEAVESPGWDVELELGDGLVLRLRRR